jgi:hypothetical protein
MLTLRLPGSDGGKRRATPVNQILRFLFFVLTLLACSWLAIHCWTAPVGFLWHAVHGRFVSFDGSKLPVPADMWVRRSENGALTLIRERPQYPLLASRSGILLLQYLPPATPDLSTNYGQISHTYVSSRVGLKTDVRRVSGTQRNGYCWEVSGVGAASLEISCRFENSLVPIEFVGTTEYRASVDSVIAAFTSQRQ